MPGGCPDARERPVMKVLIRPHCQDIRFITVEPQAAPQQDGTADMQPMSESMHAAARLPQARQGLEQTDRALRSILSDINRPTMYIAFSALDSCRNVARHSGKGRSLLQRRNTVPTRIQSAQAFDNKPVWAAARAPTNYVGQTCRRRMTASAPVRLSVKALAAAEPDITLSPG